MTDDIIFNIVLTGVFISAALVTATLLLVDAPYGRHVRSGWGPQIPTRLGWVLMESPASLFFLYFYIKGEHATHVAALILLLMWQVHYAHRAFIYPFQLRLEPGARTPLAVILPGALYCAVNGYLNGHFISSHADHLNNGWLADARFWLGLSFFSAGFYLNKSSDAILRRLRDESGRGYHVPYGGGFRWVSMPNYLGELLTWTGFAIASWSLAGASFVAFTAANLIPRAIANHKWYREKFPEYPENRKAIIPFVI